MKWPLVSIPDICRPKQWPTIQKTEMVDTGYPVYGANGQIGYYSNYNHEEPTILITCRGATCGSINVCVPKSYVTGNAMALDALNEHRADLRFVTRALEQADFSSVITGVAQPQITRQSLSRLQIPLPPLAEQKRIAAILDAADALRAKRRESLAQLDTLLQSTFLDLFGDPVTNPKGWKSTTLGTLISDVKNGLTRRRKITENVGQIVLRLKDIREGYIEFSDLNRIPLDKVEKEKFEVTDGDFLFIRVNGNPDYVGRCSPFYGYKEPVYFNDHIMRIRFNLDHIIPNTLSFLLNSDYGRQQIASYRKTSAGQHTINQDGLGNIRTFLPPLDLQRRFATIVESVEQQKARLRAHLAELDTLFASLQHRAFNGEL